VDNPDLSRNFYADGNVVTPLFRANQVDKTTSEIRFPRAERDASLAECITSG
jgi:hypothetical protein